MNNTEKTIIKTLASAKLSYFKKLQEEKEVVRGAIKIDKEMKDALNETLTYIQLLSGYTIKEIASHIGIPHTTINNLKRFEDEQLTKGSYLDTLDNLTRNLAELINDAYDVKLNITIDSKIKEDVDVDALTQLILERESDYHE